MTASTTITFKNNNQIIKEMNVESYNVVSGSRKEIHLDDVVLDQDKDGVHQLETRIRKNLSMLMRIISDQFFKAKDSSDPKYALLKWTPIDRSQIDQASSKIDELELPKVLPLILITLNEYQQLIERRDHDALLKVIGAVASTYTDKAQMGLGMAKTLLDDPNIATPTIIDKLYLCINNIHKLTRKYYKSTI